MAEYSVNHGSDSVLRDLVLVVESEPDVDPDALNLSVRQLRAKFKDLDVESVAPPTSAKAQPGAKGIDPSSLGTLLITLLATGGVVTVLIETARDWLARHAAARSISVTIDNQRQAVAFSTRSLPVDDMTAKSDQLERNTWAGQYTQPGPAPVGASLAITSMGPSG